MKVKTINAVISKKINQWLDSIEDKDLRNKVKDNVIVTGGCLTSMLLNEEVNDYDIYLKDKETVLEVAKYYTDKWNETHKGKKTKTGTSAIAWVLDGIDVESWKRGSKILSSFAYGYDDRDYHSDMEWGSENKITGPSGMLLATDKDRVKIMINSDGIAEESDEVADEVEYNVDEYIETIQELDDLPSEVLEVTKEEHKQSYRPVFLSENAITLSDKIQIVIRFYGTPEEIHKNYDFVHTTNYWTFRDGVVLNIRAMEAIMNKELFYTGSKYPIASIIRTRKFIKRGWQINAGQYLKMSLQISKLDLNNIYTLQDQLVGVDSIYFLNFINHIRQDIENGKDINLTGDYVITVIDKIFG